MKKTKQAKQKAPRHLQVATRRWWLDVAATYVLEPHHVKLLTLAGEAWDRGVQAREGLKEHGLIFHDRFGQPHARPEVAVERDNKIVFARLLRELALDIDAPPQSSRPPAIR